MLLTNNTYFYIEKISFSSEKNTIQFRRLETATWATITSLRIDIFLLSFKDAGKNSAIKAKSANGFALFENFPGSFIRKLLSDQIFLRTSQTRYCARWVNICPRKLRTRISRVHGDARLLLVVSFLPLASSLQAYAGPDIISITLSRQAIRRLRESTRTSTAHRGLSTTCRAQGPGLERRAKEESLIVHGTGPRAGGTTFSTGCEESYVKEPSTHVCVRAKGRNREEERDMERERETRDLFVTALSAVWSRAGPEFVSLPL